MQKYSIALLALAAALAISPAAKASSFDFTFTSSDGGPNATGWLVGNLVSGDLYDITSGGIDVTGNGFATGTGPLAPLNTDGSDNNLFSTASNGGAYVDFGGISFTLPGSNYINMWSNGNTTTTAEEGTLANGDAVYYDDNGTLSLTATPEPSSLFLLGTGLIGLAFVAFRKAKSTSAFSAFETV